MTITRLFKRSFAGGEITPELAGRIELPKFQTGLKTCENAIVLPHGPVKNRPGLQYIGAVKTAANMTRLIPFSYNTTQTYALEFGNGYMRVFTNGGQLNVSGVTAWAATTPYVVGDVRSNGGTNYYCKSSHTSGGTFSGANWHALTGTIFELPTPFATADLMDLHYVQSADVLTIAHPNYPPFKVYRYGSYFAAADITFGATIGIPTGVGVTPAGSGTISYSYKITAINSTGREEGLPSSAASTTNNLATAGNKNVSSWSAVSGALRYNVYCQKNGTGVWGYIGQTAGTSFTDDNIIPDTTLTPPESKLPFGSSGNYPRAVSYFEQRKVFGGTNNNPQTFWLTMSGTEANMNFSIPQQDSDGIEATVASREVQQIRHFVPLSDLLMLTSGGEWRIMAGSDAAITPATIRAMAQSYIGASNVQPAVTGNTALYVQDRGAHVREISLDWQTSGYKSTDASVMAPHLVDGYTIVDLAFVRAPVPSLWCVRSDGVLLGLTYLPEHQVVSWHKHTTDGVIESICAVSEGQEDVLYMVVQRTINGNTVRYVERMGARMFSTQADSFFVDCGLTYSGASTSTISGLSHLEGETVSVLADGAVHAPKVVTSGSITLDQAATKVHVGLPFISEIETLPIAVDSLPDAGQGRLKNVNKVWLRVDRSGALKVGPDATHLVEQRGRTTEPYGSPPALVSNEIELVLTPSWGRSGSVLIRNELPLPMTLVSMTQEVDFGG